MRIGINLLLYTDNPTIKEHGPLLERLKEMGFGCFELGVGDLDAKEIEAFAKKAKALDLTPQCTDLFPASEADLIGQDPALRKKAVARFQESIYKARDMGAKVFSGPFFQGLCSATQEGPTKREWDWAVEGLRSCAEVAARCGLLMAGEPLNRFEMHIINTLEDAYRMCKDVGLPNMGILADTHHSNIEELDIVESYTKYADRIFNIHISENNRGIPGSGHAIPTELFGAVLEAGYQGNFVIEAFNANVPATLPLLRLWRPFTKTEDEIAQKGLAFIQEHLPKQ